MNEPKRGCLTCKFADYLKTPTGRLVRDTVVRCHCPMPTADEIREALRGILPASVPINNICGFGTHGMWPTRGKDGSDCTKWEPTK